MKITQAIILAGGLGTRLRSSVCDLPKSMAPLNGNPFLFYLIKYFSLQGINKFIFSLGYKHDIIARYLDSFSSSWAESGKMGGGTGNSPVLQHLIEGEPLGTGGAIKLACAVAQEENVLVVNGDTLFKVDLTRISDFHSAMQADCTLTLKPMQEMERYGVIELNGDLSIKDFKEKKRYQRGLINGGVYALNANRFLQEDLPSKFSFEKDYLEKYYGRRKMYGIVQDEYFIDIGVPDDYARAQAEFRKEFAF
jgi:D-glycero-alpha-D-manno-heptose 1-phosphate guanylyltransferase